MPALFAAFAVPILLFAQSAPASRPAVGATARPSEHAVRKALRAVLDANFSAGRFPGASVAVAFDGGPVIAECAGFADRDAKRAMTPSDRLMTGSTGKMFFAAVALQLIHEKKLSLDDPAAKHLGKEAWFSRVDHAADVKLRDLFRHTSGIVRYELDPRFLSDLQKNPFKAWTVEERLAYLLDKPAPFAPGAGWEYSDTNYILIGAMIEKVTGKRAYDEIARRVLEPLKLRDTVPSDSESIAWLAPGYTAKDDPFTGGGCTVRDGKFVLNPQFEWAGGGFASTPSDLARYVHAYFNGRAFDASLLPQVTDAVPANLGPRSKYGLCAIVRPTTLGESFGHDGFFPGYLTSAVWFPEKHMAVAAQWNTSDFEMLNASPFGAMMELARAAAGAAE